VIRALLVSLVLHAGLLGALALGVSGGASGREEAVRVAWRLPLGEGEEAPEERVVSLPRLPALQEPATPLPRVPAEDPVPLPLVVQEANDVEPPPTLGVTVATLSKRLSPRAVPAPARPVPEVAAAPSTPRRLVLRSRPDVTPATYPREAWLRGIQGMVVVRLLVRVDGSAEPEGIAVSSGSALLDRDALTRAREYRFGPLEAPRRVDAPIRYVIRSL
jgi:protein TonB